MKQSFVKARELGLVDSKTSTLLKMADLEGRIDILQAMKKEIGVKANKLIIRYRSELNNLAVR